MEEEISKGKQQEDDRETGEEAEDMDIGDLDLEGIKQACADVEKGYVSQEQVILQCLGFKSTRDKFGFP